MSPDVDAKIASLPDWRGAFLAQVRRVIREALPDVEEEVKWRKATNPLGVPTWSQAGIICTGETYKDKVKLTFMSGNRLPDPHGLFTDAPVGTRRVIDIRESDQIDEGALAKLVKAAAAYNRVGRKEG